MDKGIIIYNDGDYRINKEFADRFINNSHDCNLQISLVLESGIKYGISNGGFYFEHNGESIHGGNCSFAVNRTRNALLASVLENLGIRVLNSSLVTALCNDKNAAYINAVKCGLNCLDTDIYTKEALNFDKINYPFVLKQPFGHGGNNVFLCRTKEDAAACLNNITGRFVTVQRLLPCDTVSDIRVFIMGNKPVGAVKRTAKEGFKANYCKGGEISLYEIDGKLLCSVEKLLYTAHFDFAGFDFLYNGDYYFNEIEDVVGSRSLCILKDIDTSRLYIEYINKVLNKK